MPLNPSDTDSRPPLAELEAAVQRSPGDSAAWRDLANAYCTAEAFELAADILGHAVRLAPRDPDARFRLGMALIEGRNPRDAIPHLQEALRLDPDRFGLRSFDLGVAFEEAGQPAAAATHFRTATEYRPSMAAAWIRLAWARSAQGHYQEAIPAFEKALLHRPTSAPLWAGLGRAYAGTEQDLQAYGLSLRHDPAQLDTLLALGACYERLGQADEAHGACRQSERVDPKSTAPLCASPASPSAATAPRRP